MKIGGYGLYQKGHHFQTNIINKYICYTNKSSHFYNLYTFIRGASPDVSDELLDKNAIGGRRWDVAAQEPKVCNMEIKTVTIVVKGSVKLTVPTD